MTSPDPYSTLREALAAGPTPGPWELVQEYGGNGHANLTRVKVSGPLSDICEVDAWPNGVGHDSEIEPDIADESLIDAAYIAAADPSTIEALLADNARLAEELDRSTAENERWREEQAEVNDLRADLAAMRQVVEAAMAWRDEDNRRRKDESESYGPPCFRHLVAAVDTYRQAGERA